MTPNQHNRPKRRPAPFVRAMIVGALSLALLFAVGNVLNVGAAPTAGATLDEQTLSCATPQVTATTEAADQSLQGYQLTTVTAATTAVSATAATTTTLTPQRPGRPGRPCGPPPRDGTARTTTGTPLADPGRHEHPTRVADPNATPGAEPPERPTRVADPDATEGTEQPDHPHHPGPRHPGNPGTRPTSDSGYPAP